MNVEGWIKRLEKIQETLNNPLSVDIVDEIDEASTIHLIKMKETRNYPQPSTFALERFDKVIGAIELSKNGLRAAHLDHIGSDGSTYGINLYSSGIHCIRFQITGDFGQYFFAGIITSLQEIIPRTAETPSAYGWWDFDGCIVNGEGQRFGKSDIIEKDDELTLTLNCDKRQIELDHHRTNSHVYLTVDLQVCPFPWKFLVGLDWRGGCVRIIHP